MAKGFDSYGECLLLLGKKEKGMKAYKKSLELNPNNEIIMDKITYCHRVYIMRVSELLAGSELAGKNSNDGHNN